MLAAEDALSCTDCALQNFHGLAELLRRSAVVEEKILSQRRAKHQREAIFRSECFLCFDDSWTQERNGLGKVPSGLVFQVFDAHAWFRTTAFWWREVGVR